MTTEHHIQDHPDAPQVTLLRVLAEEHLGCDVVRSAIHLVHGVVIRVVRLGSAKVDNLDRTAIFDVDKDVFWLEVAMCDLLSMAVGNGLQDLLGHFGSLILGEVVLADNFGEQFLAIAQLRNNMNVASALVHLIKAHDVWVIQVLQNFDLILQTHLLCGVKFKFVDDFDGAHLSIVVPLGELHLAVGTGANNFFHRVGLLIDFDVFVLDDEVFTLGNNIVLACKGLLLLHRLEAFFASRTRIFFRFGTSTAHFVF